MSSGASWTCCASASSHMPSRRRRLVRAPAGSVPAGPGAVSPRRGRCPAGRGSREIPAPRRGGGCRRGRPARGISSLPQCWHRNSPFGDCATIRPPAAPQPRRGPGLSLEASPGRAEVIATDERPRPRDEGEYPAPRTRLPTGMKRWRDPSADTGAHRVWTLRHRGLALAAADHIGPGETDFAESRTGRSAVITVIPKPRGVQVTARGRGTQSRRAGAGGWTSFDEDGLGGATQERVGPSAPPG